MVEPAKSHKIELGIELCLELAITLYQLGAEHMELPHSFLFGLFLWIVATALAIRMFWIFPWWESRLNRLEKGLISTILIGILAVVAYEPVTSSYRKHTDTEAKTNSQAPGQVPENAPSEPSKTESPTARPIPPAKPPNRSSVIKSNPIPTPSQQQAGKTGPMAIAPNGIANAAPNLGTQMVNNYGPHLRIPAESIDSLAIQLSYCKGGSTIALPHVDNPSGFTEQDANNLVMAFGRAANWRYSGTGRSIHGQDVGPNGPIPDPVGIHITASPMQNDLAMCVQAALKFIGVESSIELSNSNDVNSLGILVGNFR